MPCYPLTLTLTASFALSTLGNAQVLQNTNYQQELQHAESLLTGVSSTDIPHHIHYDLKLYDREGRESTATYDLYRDPILYTRIEIKAGGYELTHITNVRDHQEWLHYTGDMPLKVFDFNQAFDRPHPAIDRFKQEPEAVQKLLPQQLQGAPLLCANDDAGTAICFNPLIHLFAYAQMFNQTVMYDQWLPIGTHSVPGSIRIFEGKKLLVEATGTVEAVEKFPEHFMEIPATPSQPDPSTTHKITRYKLADMNDSIYGNIQVAISVDERGQVTKENVVDSDDKQIEGFARKVAHKLIFEPQIENGQPVPFDTVVYLKYYPPL